MPRVEARTPATYSPRAIRAYAEWLWIDSKFSASTQKPSKRGSAASRAGHAADQVLDEARIVVRALGDVLLVGALQDPVELARRLFLGDAQQLVHEHRRAAARTAIVTVERWLCAPYSEISFEHGHSDVTGTATVTVASSGRRSSSPVSRTS